MKRNQINDQAKWSQSWHLRLPALNIRIPELLFVSVCHIYSRQPPPPPGISSCLWVVKWAGYCRIQWQWAEKSGGCSVGVGGFEANRHTWAPHILMVREVPTRHKPPHVGKLQRICTHLLHFFLVGWPTVPVCPGLRKFPGCRTFGLKLGQSGATLPLRLVGILSNKV